MLNPLPSPTPEMGHRVLFDKRGVSAALLEAGVKALCPKPCWLERLADVLREVLPVEAPNTGLGSDGAADP